MREIFMNPATDAGKQKLPIRVRSKFTGFVVSEPSEPEQLSVIVKNYLPAISATHLQLIVKFYTEIMVLSPRKFREIEGVFIEKGHTRIEEDPEYVYTPSISSNLARVAAAVASGRFPVLLEGETSAGKTSMIVHLAKITSNRVFRINNHEHTDIQEYIGGYAPDENGKLTFIEGVLAKSG
ncbi:serine/threonine protein kinase [Aphelenchoides avenae]|nr:serine/threonine protein kinase [Aphelenchus avenae]